jgi:hypothetical protein
MNLAIDAQHYSAVQHPNADAWFDAQRLDVTLLHMSQEMKIEQKPLHQIDIIGETTRTWLRTLFRLLPTRSAADAKHMMDTYTLPMVTKGSETLPVMQLKAISSDPMYTENLPPVSFEHSWTNRWLPAVKKQGTPSERNGEVWLGAPKVAGSILWTPSPERIEKYIKYYHCAHKRPNTARAAMPTHITTEMLAKEQVFCPSEDAKKRQFDDELQRAMWTWGPEDKSQIYDGLGSSQEAIRARHIPYCFN